MTEVFNLDMFIVIVSARPTCEVRDSMYDCIHSRCLPCLFPVSIYAVIYVLHNLDVVCAKI